MQFKKKWSLSIVLLCTFAYTNATSAEDFSDLFNDEHGGTLDNAFIDTIVNESIEHNNNPAGNMKTLPSPGVALGLLKTLMIFELLRDETLFLHTNPFVSRNILDDPLVWQTFWDYPRPNVFGADLFFTNVHRMNFTEDSSSIDSYLAISQASFQKKLQIISDKVAQQQEQMGLTPYTVDIGHMLAIFKDFTAQENKLGLMFHSMHAFRGLIFRAQLPLYYLERNYFVTDEERENIEKEFGLSAPDEAAILQREHFVCDKIGFGDLRLSAAYALMQRPSYNVKVGGFTTLPTNFIIIHGLAGSAFPFATTRRTVDIRALLETSISGNFEESQRTLNSFAFGALDNLSSLLLEAPLGNKRHLSIGAFLQSKVKLATIVRRSWATNFNLKSFMAFEYLFPALEKRLYVKKINTLDFDSRNFNDANKALENLEFLETKLVDFFYPFVMDTQVSPGLILKTHSALQWRKRNWGFQIASNFWLKTEEDLQVRPECQPIITGLDIEKAKAPLAAQSRLLGSLYFKSKTQERDIIVSFNVEGTLFNHGIGEEIGISLNFETNF